MKILLNQIISWEKLKVRRYDSEAFLACKQKEANTEILGPEWPIACRMTNITSSDWQMTWFFFRLLG